MFFIIKKSEETTFNFHKILSQSYRNTIETQITIETKHKSQ